MSSIKIIFFDVDGTLVDPATGRIPHKTYVALERLHERGILICLATGRPTASLPDLTGLYVDIFCTSNGSLCYNRQQIIHSDPLSREDVNTIIQNAAAIGRPVSIALRDRQVANGYEQDLADYYGLAGLELRVAPDFEEAAKQPVYQIMVGCRESDHEALVQNTTGAKVAVSWTRAVDIIPASSGKGFAIGQILRHYGLTPSEAMAFGDSYNDLEMLQAVGIGVAMGNARDQLKAIADDVCGHVSEDGIYHYCASHGLL